MKRTVLILIMSLAMTAGSISAYADIGAPENPLYTVVTSIYGTNYYVEYDSYYSPDGVLPAGVAFYVWHDFDGVLWGSTDPKAGGDDTDSFVYVMSGDVTTESTVISPETGVKMETTVTAVTTDNLNVRTGPGTGFKVVKTLAKGTEVRYDYTFNTNSTWAYVTDGNISGWSSSDYLQTKTAVESPKEPEPEAEQAEADKEEDSSDETDSKTSTVAGIIMICVGAAILIALIAAYLIRKKPSGGR